MGEQSDHDLLIRLDAGVQALRETVTAGFEAMTKRLDKRDEDDDDTHQRFDQRLVELERRMWMLAGGALVMGAGGGFGLDRLFGK